MYPQFNRETGMLEVITGPMFSGKSEELLKRFRTLTYAKMRVVVIKPSFDTRFGVDKVSSRAGMSVEAIKISAVDEILEIADKYDAFVIDEAQFFDVKIIDIIEELLSKRKLVIVSGLDTDFKREPFQVMADLLARAEHVTKLKAVCVVCHQAATTTYRTIKNEEQNLLGDEDIYQARCRACHISGQKSK